MKIKELKRTVNVCWSPAEHYPVTLAAGSAAQQVDASFSSSSYLELYSLNLEDPGFDLEVKTSLQTEHKFHKIVWAGAGVIVGGCDGGLLEFYSAEKLLHNASESLLGSVTKHNGHVSALDINPYQKNLLASGASESEIFIWDLNNTTQPMAPGNRSQPYEHVQGVAWNQQVQHILGSTFATRCVVWDLRKNEPIMKLSDSSSRTRWRAVAWHPAVATQLCVASEDDQLPVVQIWDLRLASSPLFTLEGHHKGVTSLSWCHQDPELLLSAGKDGRVLCWNPNSNKPGGELLAEISSEQQWVFEVSWCPRSPALVATASCDHQVSVHSLLGGSRPEVNTQNQSNIMDSFGGAAGFSQLPAVSRAPHAPAPAPAPGGAPAPALAPPLPAPPRWLRRPAAANFAFGGKLVTFERCPQEAGSQRIVHISQVVSEPEIVERSSELDALLGAVLSQEPDATERLAECCGRRGDAALDQDERYTWFFLRASFMPTFRTEVLNLLGFKQDDVPSKFKSTNAVSGDSFQPDVSAFSRGESTNTGADISTDTGADLSEEAHALMERKLANLDLTPTVSDVAIPNGEDSTSLICRALVCGNLEEAVELCLEAKRLADALIIASLGSQELLFKVQKYHLNHTAHDPVSLICSSLVESRWDVLVQSAAASSWRDTLAALVTHCEGEALSHYCEMLGDKLGASPEPALRSAASICYLVGMSPDALAAGWARGRGEPRDVSELARVTSLALLARRAAAARGRPLQEGGRVEGAVERWAARLAAQGCLAAALRALQAAPRAALAPRLAAALRLAPADTARGAHQPQQQQQPQPGRSRTVSQHSQPRGSLAYSDVTNTYNAGNAVGAAYEASSWQQASVPAPQRGYPAPAMPQLPQLPQQQPQPQPARPSSVGPQSGGITTRSKYKVDPSVQSSPLYNQYSFNNPVTSQPQPYGGFTSPPPDQYAGQGAPAPPPQQAPPPQHVPPPQHAPPPANGGFYTPPQPAPGWNDPPVMSAKTKPKPEVQTQAPITHPLFGVEPPQHVPLVPAPGQYPAQQYPGQQYPEQQYSTQQYPGQQYPEQQQYQTQYPAAVAPAYPQQPASPVAKPPLPAAAAPLQAAFDELLAECCEVASSPQMKRKLEDIQRRLETLYDMLREYRLSEGALASLAGVAQLARARRFAAALQAAGALAAGADFAAVAAFLPGLRALLQLAGHHLHER